jgi:hypothetical protein
MLAQRGIEASYKTVRCWTLKFGRAFAQNLRRRRPRPTGRWLCSAITRSRRRGRRQIFVMQAAQNRSGAHPEGLADPMAGEWCR